MLIIIDNGHGEETAGKRSPDGRLHEWQWTRAVAVRMHALLEAQGIAVHRLVGETKDVPLRERVARANRMARGHRGRALLVSIHNNAKGSDGAWHTAQGWSVHVSENASERSKLLAQHMAQAARSKGFKVRDPKASPLVDYWTQNLAICRDTICPAVLVENFFMDNREDCAFLLSQAGQTACAEVMVEGIVNYIEGL